MRLNFSVLWFDDTEEYFDSIDLEPLRQEVSLWGFDLEIKTVTTPQEFRSYTPFKAFDLIVVDRNLEGYPDGQEFIFELRNNAIYTEIIFYTVGNISELWDAIREKQLEGVFVSHRRDILPKITRVGYHSIQKVLDLENMRGIVMAEVGELDHLLDDIIRLGMESLRADQQQTIFTKFHDGASKQNENFGVTLAEFSARPDIRTMLDMCDSNKRWQNFNRLRKFHKGVMEKDGIGDYEREVLFPRNSLAHGKPEASERGVVFHYRGKEYVFDDDASLILRKQILIYKDIFSEIIRTLQNG